MRAGELVAGRFEIEAEVGAGGMGAVFRARDRSCGELVAVKVIRTAGEGELRFAREAEALAELRHPGIVRYIDHGTTAAGERFLVMEWLAGESLEERLLEGPLAVEECVSIIRQVSQALSVAHRRGIVHRDIKPGNLVIESQGLTKIVDFGVVRLRDRDHLVTQAGVMMGTPAYMAPEQARGERELDVRADVFSLGVVLYECLTGVSPFFGEHLMAVLAKILVAEVRRVEELRPEVSPALAELVHSMLCRSPAGRPADAMVVARALREMPRVKVGSASIGRQRAPLTLREQCLVSVILVAPDDAPDPSADTYDGRFSAGSAPTMSEGGERPQIDGVRRAAKAFGGELELLADRSMLVTLRTGSAATDQAASTALCALALRAVLEGVVIVLATASGEAGGRRPFGAALDRAVAVLGAVSSAGIYLDEVTAGLLDERFCLEEVGRGAQRCVQLRGEILRDKPTRMLMGRPTPCVGRRRELQIMEMMLEEAQEECTAQAVLVTAPAGFGKSRLRYEFVDRLRHRPGVVIWTARCDPMGAGSPFGLVARLLRSAFGIRDGEPEVSFSKIAAGVAAALPPRDHQRVTAFLGELCGTPAPAEADVQLLAARRDPQVMADQLGRAWEDYIGSVFAGETLLLILEDLQWGDLPSVALLDRVLRHLERPMLLLALARPEVHGVFERLWVGRGITEIQLRPLSRRASRALIVEVLGDADEGLCARMIEQAAGNALYLEELIRAAADGRGEVLPGSVLAMLQARLQRLEPGARKVLRAASIFGQVFWQGGVQALLGEEAKRCPHWLERLVEDEVISARTRTTPHFVDEIEYVFHHDLVRTAAYAMLTADDRKLGHLYAGEWLERHGERDSIALALHFERGGDKERAVAHFVQAAIQAVEGNDFQAAIEHAERGLSCGAVGQERGRLLLQSAVARHWLGDYTEAKVDASRAASCLAVGSAQWYEAVSVLMTTAGSGADHEVLAQTVVALQAATPQEGACAERLIAAAHAVVQLNHTGRYALAESLLTWTRACVTDELASEPQVVGWIERAAFMRAASNLEPGPLLLAGVASTEAFTAAGDLRMACYQGMNLGYSKIVVGLYEEANEVLESAAVMARRLHLEHLFASIDSYLGYSIGLGGAFDEGVARLEAAVRDLQREGITRMEVRARNYLALLLLTGGRRIEAAAMIREAIAKSDALPATRALAETTAAHIAVLEGRVDAALEGTHALLEILLQQGSIEDGEPLLRLTHARALLLSGAIDKAREVVGGAYHSIVTRARTIDDPAIRESFLSRVSVNAWTIALYRELGGDV
ncbi:MAG TPA: serine/threonine-protein kinase PknK [Nannocystis exedens]|nr:serine/threonine-protein kinase PknK [Nannocystis exedens]